MPFLARSAGGSSTAYGQRAATVSGKPFWIAVYGDSGTAEIGKSIAIDSDRNVYAFGRSNNPGTDDLYLAKFNSSGTLVWQSLLNSNQADGPGRIAIDSSNNIYVCGVRTIQPENGRFAWHIAKYNTSGSVVWQTTLGGNQYKDDRAQSIAVDSSGNVYVGGYGTAPNAGIILAKYNSSGTLQWQNKYAEGAGYGTIEVAVDASGNPHILGSTSTIDFQIIKCDSSGAIVWQRSLASADQNVQSGIKVDSSGNVYVCGTYINTAVSYDGINALLAKYDSSGTLQWQKRIQSTTGANGMTVDSAGNVYICGGGGGGLIMKYNSSGNIVWQRRLVGTAGYSGSDVGAFSDIITDRKNTVYVIGGAYLYATQWNILVAKLPADGSKTGTYSVGGINYTYSASIYTHTDAALTSSTTSLSAVTSTLPINNFGGMGVTTPTFTAAVTTL